MLVSKMQTFQVQFGMNILFCNNDFNTVNIMYKLNLNFSH